MATDFYKTVLFVEYYLPFKDDTSSLLSRMEKDREFQRQLETNTPDLRDILLACRMLEYHYGDTPTAEFCWDAPRP
jgi:DNA-directed RNA polymerase specialized sigma24 family protein